MTNKDDDDDDSTERKVILEMLRMEQSSTVAAIGPEVQGKKNIADRGGISTMSENICAAEAK